MGIQIRAVSEGAEKFSVFRLRYDIYVKEMNRVQKYADHDQQIIREPLDEDAVIFGAFDHGKLVGTIRVNYTNTCDVGEYVKWYRMSEFRPFFPSRTSVTTKLMLSPQYRSTAITVRFAKAVYEAGLSAGVCFDFMDCNSHLVPYFEKIGYRQVFPNVLHPEYGDVHPMVFVYGDVGHLTNIGSPLTGHVGTLFRHHQAMEFFSNMANRSLVPA
jgi:hypothetical protein